MSARRLTLILTAGLLAFSAGAAETPEPTTDKEKASYSLGVNLGRELRRQGLEFDVNQLLRGVQDGHSASRLLISEQELGRILNQIQTESRRKMARFRDRPEAAIKLRGEAFLAANRTNQSVVTLPSGVQYQVIREGTGPKPAPTSTVQCQYRGAHLDGKEFIGTQPAQPATFKVGDAQVPAFSEVLPLMPVGAKWRLFVPPQWAYGFAGIANIVAPNETLLFDLELVSIQTL